MRWVRVPLPSVPDSCPPLPTEIDDVVCSFRVWKERHHPLRSDSARRISAATGVRVFVPGKADPADAVQLEGPIVAVVRAFYLFQAELYRMATQPARTVLKIPAAKVGLLIGTAGKTVKEIKSRTNAIIDFHGHDAEAAARGAQAEAVIHGATDSVALAKEIIERVVAGAMPRDVFTSVQNDMGVVLNVEGLLQATKGQGRGAGGKGNKGGSGGGGGRGGGGGKGGKRRGGGNKKRGNKANSSGGSGAGGAKTGGQRASVAKVVEVVAVVGVDVARVVAERDSRAGVCCRSVGRRRRCEQSAAHHTRSWRGVVHPVVGFPQVTCGQCEANDWFHCIMVPTRSVCYRKRAIASARRSAVRSTFESQSIADIVLEVGQTQAPLQLQKAATAISALSDQPSHGCVVRGAGRAP